LGPQWRRNVAYAKAEKKEAAMNKLMSPRNNVGKKVWINFGDIRTLMT